MSSAVDIYFNEKDKKNKQKLVCTKCPSVILRPNEGTYVEKEIELPLMNTNEELKKQLANGQTVDPNQIEVEKVKDCWLVEDVYNFENLGVSKTVDGLKYLICADCEFGPIGIHYLESKKFYVAINRVNHKD